MSCLLHIFPKHELLLVLTGNGLCKYDTAKPLCFFSGWYDFRYKLYQSEYHLYILHLSMALFQHLNTTDMVKQDGLQRYWFLFFFIRVSLQT